RSTRAPRSQPRCPSTTLCRPAVRPLKSDLDAGGVAWPVVAHRDGQDHLVADLRSRIVDLEGDLQVRLTGYGRAGVRVLRAPHLQPDQGVCAYGNLGDRLPHRLLRQVGLAAIATRSARPRGDVAEA